MVFGIVHPVAISADRSVYVAAIGKDSVGAGGVCLDNFSMAYRAIDLRGDCGARPTSCGAGPGMALGAGRVTMDRVMHLESINI